MLKRTFFHIEGIGLKSESLLWQEGIATWENAMAPRGLLLGIVPRLGLVERGLTASFDALHKGDSKYFEERLRASDMWRIWSQFRNRACFLDIETTGLPPEPIEITVACVSDWQNARIFVRGHNLRQLPAVLDSYCLIVTFNGKTFDLPCIRREFPKWQCKPGHLDLLYPLRKAGYHGTLKDILRRLHISEGGVLDAMDGWMAPILWDEYLKGKKKALDTLKAYNINDVKYLPHLADYVYNYMIRTMPFKLPCLKYRKPLQNPYEPSKTLINKLLSGSIYSSNFG